MLLGGFRQFLSLHSAARVLILDTHCIELCIRHIKFAIRLLRVSSRVLFFDILTVQVGVSGLLERGFGPKVGGRGVEEAESVPFLEFRRRRIANFIGGVSKKWKNVDTRAG